MEASRSLMSKMSTMSRFMNPAMKVRLGVDVHRKMRGSRYLEQNPLVRGAISSVLVTQEIRSIHMYLCLCHGLLSCMEEIPAVYFSMSVCADVTGIWILISFLQSRCVPCYVDLTLYSSSPVGCCDLAPQRP